MDVIVSGTDKVDKTIDGKSDRERLKYGGDPEP